MIAQPLSWSTYYANAMKNIINNIIVLGNHNVINFAGFRFSLCCFDDDDDDEDSVSSFIFPVAVSKALSNCFAAAGEKRAREHHRAVSPSRCTRGGFTPEETSVGRHGNIRAPMVTLTFGARGIYVLCVCVYDMFFTLRIWRRY